MTTQQNETTKRFVNSLKSLVDGGNEGTLKDIAGKLEYNYSALNQIYNGRRPAPKHLLRKFTEVYSEEPKGDWKDEKIAFLKEQVDFYKTQLDDLKRRLELNSDEIKKQGKWNRDYLMTIYKAFQEHRAKTENVPLKKIQDSMDSMLASFP